MLQFPATLECCGMRLEMATPVSAIVIFGPYQKEDKLGGPAHLQILKSAVLNLLSKEHKTKFAEAEATQNEASLTACALHSVETMRACGLNVIPKLKIFLNKHFFTSSAKRRAQDSEVLLIHHKTSMIHPKYIRNTCKIPRFTLQLDDLL